MKILLLGPVHREREFLKQRGKLPFVKGQGQQSWVEALQRLGHKVFVFCYTDSILIPNRVRVYTSELFERVLPLWKARYDRFRDAYYFISLENFLKNKKLLVIAKEFKPQLIIISGGMSSIYPTTVKKIKGRYKCKVLLFSGVNPIISSTVVERIMVGQGIIDIVVENDRGYARNWEKMGVRKTIVLPISSIDPKLHRKVRLTKEEKDEFECDVCFVGSLTRERQEILKSILEILKPFGLAQGRQVQAFGSEPQARRDYNYSLKIWGDIPLGIRLDKELLPYYHGKAFGGKMVKIFNAAKIVLNFQPEDMTHGGNMRSFEIPGCGAFQLANKVDSEWFKEGKEVVSFNSADDLKKKISYYLKNEKKRNEIAENGYERARKEHTYDKHFEKLLSQI